MSATEDGNESQPGSGRKRIPDDLANEIQASILGVGYQRPPEHTRFKKGQSGNPKGRPRRETMGRGGDQSANNIILREASRSVTIREGDETKEISAIEAVVRAQQLLAIKGQSAYAQKHIIEKYDRAERERRQEVREEIDLWKDIVDATRAAWAAAEKEGEPSPKLLPHPDDVVFDDETGVSFIGPVNEASEARFNKKLELRDLLYVQAVLEDRQAAEEEKYRNSAHVFAEELNRAVPVRFRLSSTQLYMKLRRFEVMPKRQLLKHLYRAWREFGLPRRRGWILPPFVVGAKTAELLIAVSDELLDCSMDAYLKRLGAFLPADWAQLKRAA